MNPILTGAVSAHLAAVEGFFSEHADAVERVAELLAASFKNGGTLLVCGNGGSACDALHIAGEFVGRFVNDRPALPAIALAADAGAVTAIGNDYGFEQAFSRQVEAYAKAGDVLIGISTSGSSANVLAALRSARLKGAHAVLLTGQKGKTLAAAADYVLAVPSAATARVQEVHITVLHVIASLVEARLFPEIARA